MMLKNYSGTDDKQKHNPDQAIPASNTWDAIAYVMRTLQGLMGVSSKADTALALAAKAQRDAKNNLGQAILQAQVFN